MIENLISGYLYNELFSERNEEKSTAFQSMAWSLVVHKKYYHKLLNCSPSIFLPVSHFVYFISFFIKAKILLQFLNQAFSILYIFSPFSFVFILCFNLNQDRGGRVLVLPPPPPLVPSRHTTSFQRLCDVSDVV